MVCVPPRGCWLKFSLSSSHQSVISFSFSFSHIKQKTSEKSVLLSRFHPVSISSKPAFCDLKPFVMEPSAWGKPVQPGSLSNTFWPLAKQELFRLPQDLRNAYKRWDETSCLWPKPARALPGPWDTLSSSLAGFFCVEPNGQAQRSSPSYSPSYDHICATQHGWVSSGMETH